MNKYKILSNKFFFIKNQQFDPYLNTHIQKPKFLISPQSKSFCELPILMKTIMRNQKGELFIDKIHIPILKENEVMMKIEATGLNRADLEEPIISHHQKDHKSYPLLGLECSGYIVGEDKNKKVMALVEKGGFSEYIAVKKEHLIEMPQNIDVITAATIPEAWVTAYGLCKLANVHKGDYVLIHAAASGVGTALIQLVRMFQGESICFVSSDLKLNFCSHLGQGSSHVFLRKDTSRSNKVFNATHSKGCSVIFDCIGASEFDHNINDAAIDCRWVSYGFLGGSRLESLELSKLMTKRLNLHFYNLRSHGEKFKTKLLNDFAYYVMPKFATGEIVPVLDTVYNVEDIKDAQKKMTSDLNIGKIVIQW